MKKIYYICHYSDFDNNRKGALSATTKIDYIVETIKKCNCEVEILSFCGVNDKNSIFKKYNGYNRIINNCKVHFFNSYASRYRTLRVIGRFFTWLEQKKYIKTNCFSNDNEVIIYHSLSLFKLYKLLNKIRKKYTIEVEEIYSDVVNKKTLRNKEINYLQKGAKYIFPTNLLNNILNVDNKPYIIVHGTYKVEKEIGKFKLENNEIHCVYAGTFDPRKGGIVAVDAAEYLPSNYHMHILGFGSSIEVENMKKEIEKIAQKSKAKITYDGLLTGDEYIKFIQSCDIGLSTQNSDAEFNETSFPSKILSYMANGLRVVSIRLHAIESSKIGHYIYYYDRQKPEEIANAIMEVNTNDSYDSISLIKQLDNEFKKDMAKFIGGAK